MAYYNGTANDMAAVRTALVNACVAEGWAWNSSTEMLSKGAMFLRLQVVGGFLQLLGRTSSSAGDAPNVVKMGPVTSGYSTGVSALPVFTYPVAYEIFVFAQEVYCVINYSVDVFQWCAFGQSTVQGLPGTKMWLGATSGGAQDSYFYAIYTSSMSGVNSGDHFCPLLFWQTSASAGASNYFVHSDLDAQGWGASQVNDGSEIGVTATTPLLGLLPNAWSSEAVLLPLRAYKIRPSSKVSLTADLAFSRLTRIDNYSPGEIITIGSDRWKIFPFFRKNSSARDGAAAHTGTFGWAIRYEGP